MIQIVAEAEPLSVDKTSQAFIILIWLLVILFLVLFAITVVRYVIRSRERKLLNKTDSHWDLEDLFDPEEMGDLARRLDVTAAAAKTDLHQETVETLNRLVAEKARIVAIKADVIWLPAGGKQRIATVVFNDTTILRFAVLDNGLISTLDPSLTPEIADVGISPDGNIRIMFNTRKDMVTLDVQDVLTVEN